MTINPLKILTIDEINNKSVTVTIDGDFSGTEDFTVCKMSDPNQIIGIIPVDDSVKPATNKKVIVAKDTFEKGTGYTLIITRDNDEDSQNFTIGDFTPPNYASIEVYGDRILKVDFTTPINNLAATNHPDSLDVVIPDELYDELRNFYCIYNNLNNSASDAGHGVWVGIIRIWDDDDVGRPVDRNLVPNTIRVAPDFKSIEIQYNFKSIPIGDNKIIVNYSHNQSQNFNVDKNLEDFAVPPRQVPTITLDFNIVKSDITAKAIACESLSRTEFVVTYDKPVIVLENYKFGCILVNGLNATINEVSRVGNDFNKVKFELDVNSALPLNSANITVGPITDACGYQTSLVTFNNVPVISAPPKIKSLIQIDPPNDKSTALLAIWSEAMQYAPNAMKPGDVCDVKNYTLQDSNANIITIKKLTYDIATNELTILTDKLDTGLYFFHAEKANDILGETMNPQDFSINIEDRTIPNVVEVVFRRDLTSDNKVNAFVVKFDDVMSTSGEHSATDIKNYIVEKVNSATHDHVITKDILDSHTTSLAMNKNKWVRFVLPNTFDVLPPKPIPDNLEYKLRIGYSLIKNIRYVEDASKNIYPLCKTHKFRRYSIFDISNGDKYIKSDSKLIFKYTGKNEIYSVSVSDFTFNITKSDGSILSTAPIRAVNVDWKTIEFTFPQNTFDGNMREVKMNIVQNPSSLDLFGEPFKGGVTNENLAQNGLSPELKAVSLIDKDITNQTVTLRFVFTKNLFIFNVEDFKVTLTGYQSQNGYQIPLMVSSVLTTNPSYIFDVIFNVPYSTGIVDVFMVSLANPNYILSKDSNGNPLASFDPIAVNKLLVSNLVWNYQTTNATLLGNSVEITFNNPIDSYSVIRGWDGTSMPILAGSIIFAQDSAAFVMNIDPAIPNNFGTIRFYPNSAITPPFISGTITNSVAANITLVNQTKLVIQFDNTIENAPVNANAITYVEYIGDVDICDIDGKYYLYKAYRPTDIL